MKKLLLLTGVWLLSLTAPQARAQCQAIIGSTGMNCLNDTLLLTVKDVIEVEWKINGRTTQIITGVQPPVYGHTVAGAKKGVIGYDNTHLTSPAGICLDARGNLYVADYGSNRIKKWTPGAMHSTVVAGDRNGVQGTDSFFLSGPDAVFVDIGQNIYVVDHKNNRVQKWANGYPYGTTVAGQSNSASGTDSAHLSFPSGLYVDQKGNVYVSDTKNNRVQKWAPGAKWGVTVAGSKTGTSGSNPLQLHFPAGVSMFHGALYICDMLNNRVQMWDSGGRVGATVAGDSSGVSGSDSLHLNNPTGIFFDKVGNMFIADMGNNRIQEFAPHTKIGITVAGDRSGISGIDSGHFYNPTGIVLDNQGDLYIADDSNHRVQEWSLFLLASTLKKATDTAGGYTALVTYANGCVAISNTVLIGSPTDSSIDTAICSGHSVNFNGKTYTATGAYSDTFVNLEGCDSIVTLHLKVNNTGSYTINASICSGLAYNFNGISYAVAGTYMDTLKNRFGCDSVNTLHLSVNYASAATVYDTVCSDKPLKFHGNIYSSTGTYVDTIRNSKGCDSVVTIHLMVKTAGSLGYNASVCYGKAYTFNGKTYTASGTYTDTLTNKIGCDSIVTLTLIVNNKIIDTVNASICNGKSYTLSGKKYAVAGTYVDTLTARHGCDSVVVLLLTVNNSSTGSVNGVICSGRPLIYNGKRYTVPGIYTDTFTNAKGCDSIVTLTLKFDSVGSSTINIAICMGESIGFNGNIYSTSGVYYDTTTNTNGCDSIIKLSLTVISASTINVNDTIKPGHTVTINNKVYKYAGKYTDTLKNVSLQCDSIVFLITIHVMSGTGNIIDAGKLITIYPNPAKGRFTIDAVGVNYSGKARVQVLNMLGQTVQDQLVDIVNNKIHLAIKSYNIPNGIYFVKLTIGTNNYINRVVIDN